MMLDAFLSVNDQQTLLRFAFEQNQRNQQPRKQRQGKQLASGKRKQPHQLDACITYSTDFNADERAKFAAALDAAQQKKADAEYYQRTVSGCTTLAEAAVAVQAALAAAGMAGQM
jgi:hypothetical protein